MTREETLALFAQGRDAWNGWAKQMLAERKALEAAGKFPAREGLPPPPEAQDWLDRARGDFSGETATHEFPAGVDFSGFVFPGDARFGSATFTGDTRFDSATFERNAWFYIATFNGEARFNRATFKGHTEFASARFKSRAGFAGATFEGTAMFSGTTFVSNAWFRTATFADRAEFDGARFSGEAQFGIVKYHSDASFYGATFTGNAGFDSTTFEGQARFGRARFSGNAGFGNATFKGDAWFAGVTVESDAWFHRVTFKRNARFERVTFMGDARFGGAAFQGNTWFESSTFKGDAEFTGTTFKGIACLTSATFGKTSSFDGAVFHGSASFHAAEGKGAFSLAGARFHAVPDFIQAHFGEAPRLDNVRVEPPPMRLSTRAGRKKYFNGDRDLAARWRALKRLAIQGHDHGRELEFFARELKARRFVEDKWLSAPFLFGWLYQWFSDFGRSVLRPLGAWAVSTAAFAGLYLSVAGSSSSCLAGSGTPWGAALGISLHKGLVFIGQGSSAVLDRYYACLYGFHSMSTVHPPPVPLPERFVSVIPDAAFNLGLAQALVSAVFIFLILLALRNHFRIK